VQGDPFERYELTRQQVERAEDLAHASFIEQTVELITASTKRRRGRAGWQQVVVRGTGNAWDLSALCLEGASLRQLGDDDAAAIAAIEMSLYLGHHRGLEQAVQHPHELRIGKAVHAAHYTRKDLSLAVCLVAVFLLLQNFSQNGCDFDRPGPFVLAREGSSSRVYVVVPLGF
jgi:hypothetical protein